MRTTPSSMLLAIAGLAALAAGPAIANQAQPLYSGYNYAESAPQGAEMPLLFGFAAYKICQLKTFLFAGVYILGAIAFVVFAIKALFTKFEMKNFVPILGALFIVATADLFIAWMSDTAYYCPTAFSMMAG